MIGAMYGCMNYLFDMLSRLGGNVAKPELRGAVYDTSWRQKWRPIRPAGGPEVPNRNLWIRFKTFRYGNFRAILGVGGERRRVIFESLGVKKKHGDLNIMAPPSMSAARQIFRRALATGCLFWGESFKRKCALRRNLPGFNSVDLANVIRRCNIIGGPVLNAAYHGWEYELSDQVEGFKFVVVLCLDGTADYLMTPQLTILSGEFRRGRINRRRRGIRHDDTEGGNEQNPSSLR